MRPDPSAWDCAPLLIVGALTIVFRRSMSRSLAERREILDPDHYVPTFVVAGVVSILLGAAVGLVWVVG